MDFNLLIDKKGNAEVYNEQIKTLKNEISELKTKMELTMFNEEKQQYKQEIDSKNQEIEECQNKYNEKKTLIEADIEKAKVEFENEYSKIEKGKISKADYEKIEKDKEAKEKEIEDCSKEISELQEKINSVTSKAESLGYDLDIASIAKKLEEQVAYKTYLQEEKNEIAEKLKDAIVIEDNMEELKYISYNKMRLADLNYDNLESWYKKEQEYIEEFKSTQPQPAQTQPTQTNYDQFLSKEFAEKYGPQKQPIQPQSTQSQPAQPKTAQPKPAQPKPAQSQPTQSQPTQPQSVSTNIKPQPATKQVKQQHIKIDALNGMLCYYDGKNDFSKDVGLNYPKKYWKNENILKAVDVVAELCGMEPENLAKKCDPNVINLLSLEKDNKTLIQYVSAMANETQPPFDILYNLKGMYNCETLTNREKRYMARCAKNIEKTGLYVERDSLKDRIKGWIYSHLDDNTSTKAVAENKRKMLADPNDKNNIFSSNKLKEKAENDLSKPTNVKTNPFKKGLEVTVKGINKAYHYTSKKLNRSKLVNNIRMRGEIAGRKITGYFKGENSLKVKSDVNKIKEDYRSR